MKAFLKRHKYPLGFFALLLIYACGMTAWGFVMAWGFAEIDGGPVPIDVDLRMVGMGVVWLAYVAFLRMFTPTTSFIPNHVQLPVMVIVPLVVGIVVWICTKRKISALLWCVVVYVAATLLTNELILFLCFLLVSLIGLGFFSIFLEFLRAGFH